MPLNQRRRRKLPLTVAIAAKANDGSIFCATDRMITVGDIEMESPATKMFMLTNSIVVMPSDDDAALHTEILNETHVIANAAIADNPSRWPLVSEVVTMYVAARDAKHAKRAEQEFLLPLGLTRETFLDRMAFLEPQLVSRIAEDLISYRLPAMSVIIAGIDPIGSHIYEVNDGKSGCLNTIGYAAIGAGARHALAHFMLAEQCNSTSPVETLWNTYFAKRRSEVAPGVGKQVTDIGMIGPQLGFSVNFTTVEEPPIMRQLEAVYENTKRAEEEARKNAATEMVEYVKRVETERLTKAQPTPESPPSGDSQAITG